MWDAQEIKTQEYRAMRKPGSTGLTSGRRKRSSGPVWKCWTG